MDEIIYSSIAELTTLIRNKELSPLEVTEAYLSRIRTLNPSTHAFISVCGEKAYSDASRPYQDHPLSGIPYSCKDLFKTKGITTTGGSEVFADYVPDESANAVDRLSAAGAVLLGKNNLHEFAYGATGENKHFGTVPNPFDLTRLAGGSSSGSAAAVALGMSAFALGTDTGGSVRAPAALCGVVGLKPTQGRISLGGVVPYCWTLDHAGTFTRTVADAALLLDTLAGYDPMDPGSANVPKGDYLGALHGSLKGKRIGVPTSFFFDHCDPEILAVTHRAIAFFEQEGAQIVPVDMPSMEHSRTVSLTVQLPEALSYHSQYLEKKGALYSSEFRSGFAAGQFILAEHYVRAKRMIEWYRQQMALIFGQVDALITPGCPITAPKIGSTVLNNQGKKEPAGNAITRYLSFFNMSGNPAMTVPAGLHSDGLPMSIQLVGGLFDESTLFTIAHRLEQHLQEKQRIMFETAKQVAKKMLDGSNLDG